jgi:hypothetical protein
MALDAASVVAVDGARRASGGVRPLAEGYTFAALPATIERLLLGRGDGGLPRAALGDAPDRVERVVLVLLDAFGWRFFARTPTTTRSSAASSPTEPSRSSRRSSLRRRRRTSRRCTPAPRRRARPLRVEPLRARASTRS